MIRSALGTTSGALNEVSTRIILDNLLIHAHAIATTTTTTTTTTQTRQGQAIHMHADKGLWLVRIKRSKLEGEFYLTGRPDYAFWYGRVKETEVNVVIVKAKAEEKPGLARCLAYMGKYLLGPLGRFKTNLISHRYDPNEADEGWQE